MVLICMYAKFSPTQRCRPERGEGKSLDNIIILMISKDSNWRHKKAVSHVMLWSFLSHPVVTTMIAIVDIQIQSPLMRCTFTIRVIQKTNIVQVSE